MQINDGRKQYYRDTGIQFQVRHIIPEYCAIIHHKCHLTFPHKGPINLYSVLLLNYRTVENLDECYNTEISHKLETIFSMFVSYIGSLYSGYFKIKRIVRLHINFEGLQQNIFPCSAQLPHSSY